MPNALTAQEEGFEGAGVGRWAPVNWPIEVSSAVAHSGSQSLKATAPASGFENVGIQIWQLQLSGLPKSVSFWVYRSTSVRAHGYAEFSFFNSASEFLGMESLPLLEWASSTWTNYAYPVEAPASTAKFNIALYTGRVLNNPWATGDTLYYDDMVIEVGGSKSLPVRKRQLASEQHTIRRGQNTYI